MLNSLLNFVFYPMCAGCDEPGETICPQCLEGLMPAKLKCHKCDRKNPYGIYCQKCANKLTAERVLALYDFSGAIKELIHSFKYEDEKELSDIFGEKMAEFISALNLKNFDLVPVPISKKRQRFRGYNQAELLACVIAKKTGLRYADILQKNPRQNSQVQSGSRKQRKANVKGAFSVKNGSNIPQNVLLIDDVVTTGATVEEATKVLKKAGAIEVVAVALAMG